MKKIFFTLFFIFIFFKLYSDDIKNYEFILIKKIEIGKEEGKIGFLKKIGASGMPRGPMTFTVSENGDIYVQDFANYRINVYDLDLNYKHFIIEKENEIIRHTGKIYIDDTCLIAYTTGLGLKKINQAGKTLLYLDTQSLPINFRSNTYFLINKNIIYYDDTGFIKSITPDGKIKDSAETLNIIKEIEKKEVDNTREEMQKALAEKKNILVDIQSKEKHIIIGDKYYNSNFYYTIDFFKKTKGYYEEKKATLDSKKTEKNTNKIEIDNEILLDSTFLDYDKEHNSYWKNFDRRQKKWKRFVFIYSNYGEIIDAFYYEDIRDKNVLMGDDIKIAIAPSGDVYFMRNDETGSYFWKVERRW